MTRAPSPCSADSSSEASAKEDATQGKPTDDELREIEAKAEMEIRYAYGNHTLANNVLRLLAALRAAQAERDGWMARYELLEASSLLRAEAAERERDALREALVTAKAFVKPLADWERKNGFMGAAVPHEVFEITSSFVQQSPRQIEQVIDAALAPRPPVKEEK